MDVRASFGSYELDEATHTVIHHVQGSITGDLLVGRNAAQVYQFTRDEKLILRSALVRRALVRDVLT